MTHKGRRVIKPDTINLSGQIFTINTAYFDIPLLSGAIVSDFLNLYPSLG